MDGNGIVGISPHSTTPGGYQGRRGQAWRGTNLQGSLSARSTPPGKNSYLGTVSKTRDSRAAAVPSVPSTGQPRSGCPECPELETRPRCARPRSWKEHLSRDLTSVFLPWQLGTARDAADIHVIIEDMDVMNFKTPLYMSLYLTYMSFFTNKTYMSFFRTYMSSPQDIYMSINHKTYMSCFQTCMSSPK